MAGRPWTADEIAAIAACPSGGTTAQAAQFGHTVHAVRHKRKRLACPPMQRPKLKRKRRAKLDEND